MADTRYQLIGVSNTDIHPRVKQMLSEIKDKKEKKDKKDKKDKKKKDKMKKRRSEIMGEFQIWIKDTNRLLLLLSLVFLFIQTAVPVYNLRRDINLELIDLNDSINPKGVQFIIAKLKSLMSKYPDNVLFQKCISLINDENENIEEQFKQTILYCNSSTFPQIIERNKKYKLFIQSEKKKFIRNEWTTYRPLSATQIVTNINKYLEQIDQVN